MIADLGSAALILALVACAYSVIFFGIGIGKQSERALMSARNGLFGVVILVCLASAALLWGLFSHDFSLEYVASYSSLATPVLYVLSGFWAGNAGSLLFWALVLAICGLVIVLQQRKRNPGVVPYVSIAVLATEGLFLLLMVFVQSPFQKLPVAAVDGTGLNPLLENIGMIYHPPTLLAGYAVVTIPFALAVGALFTRKMDDFWLGSMRKWTLISWLLLGVGNILGMQWAYVELSFNGYWAWDAVENAGLMPWLVLTALLHSLMIQRRLGIFKGWNMALAGASFFLAIFGTFLTRSNILSSVHTFGETGMEPYFLFFLTLGIILYTGIMITRSSDLFTKGPAETLLSRETGFAANNLVLVAATVVILLGTMSPLISRLFTGNTVTVGPSFFNSVAGPILILVVLLMGICPLLAWFKTSPGKLWRNLSIPLYVAVVVVLVLVLLAAFKVMAARPLAVFSFAVFALVAAVIFQEWIRGTRARHKSRGENYLQAFGNLIFNSRARYGGYIVHIGVILLAMGILASSFYSVTKEITLNPGEAVTIQEYTLTYKGLTSEPRVDRDVVTAEMNVVDGVRPAGNISPYIVIKEPFGSARKVAIRTALDHDLYVVLERYQGNAAAFTVSVHPLVLWIWIGGILLLLGTVLALWPARKKEEGTR